MPLLYRLFVTHHLDCNPVTAVGDFASCGPGPVSVVGLGSDLDAFEAMESQILLPLLQLLTSVGFKGKTSLTQLAQLRASPPLLAIELTPPIEASSTPGDPGSRQSPNAGALLRNRGSSRQSDILPNSSYGMSARRSLRASRGYRLALCPPPALKLAKRQYWPIIPLRSLLLNHVWFGESLSPYQKLFAAHIRSAWVTWRCLGTHQTYHASFSRKRGSPAGNLCPGLSHY